MMNFLAFMRNNDHATRLVSLAFEGQKKDAGLASFRCFCLSHARTFLFVPKRDAIATGSAEGVTLTLGLAAGLFLLFWGADGKTKARQKNR